MKAMILAAGFGTRFRPATYTIPKPMVPVCNRPLIAYAVDSLVAAGVREIVVNLHHLPEAIETYLRSTYVGICTFEFSFEPEILGTGGGLRKARDLFTPGESFLLVNGDTIQFPRFAELEAARREKGALAALLLRHPPEGDRFTQVYCDGGLITGFGSGSGEPLMFSGSHSIGPEIFDLLPDRDFSGITEDVYLPLVRSGQSRLAGVIHDGPWFDIGTPARYMRAAETILELIVSGELRAASGTNVSGDHRSVVAVDAKTAGEIHSSSIGFGSVIGRGSSISRSAIWDDVEVGNDCVLTESIISSAVTLPPSTTCENVLCCAAASGHEYPEGAIQIGELVGVPIDANRASRLTIAGL